MMKQLEKFLAWITGKVERMLPAQGMVPQRNKGSRIVLVLLGGFFLWAVLVPLSKGVVAPGTVVVDSKRKTIQHLEGGVIKAIHVRDGSRVEQGDVLLELDDTKSRAERDMVRFRYLNKLAMLDRLKALVDAEPQIAFSEPLLAAKSEVEVSELLRLQLSVFRVLRLEHDGKAGIARQRIGQLVQKLKGLEAYREATTRQVALLGNEVDRLQGLMQKRLVESSVIADRLQQLSQQNGELGKTVASIAETQVGIGEAKLNVLQVEREWQQDLAKQLSETQELMIELRAQLEAAQNVFSRTVIKAPITGTVLGLKATTVGGVLTTGNPIMDVVPEGDVLVIDAHVRPLDVDSVRKGMTAHVKFTSFRAKTTPELLGVIENVSADVLTEPTKGEPYYLMRVTVSGEEMKKLSGLEIVPGMPAEVYSDGGSRTMMQYLFEPISSLMHRSVRED
ncbi:HlyD family type I secretion periplasmic adaptor subunit [Propionivibrio sp.]|uniref:HlyD family type I secretion periplasmic adaptor subunit n=1 Tax=Propionivibrio sp. TaxID=2212460 RepID=UPI003BF0B853